MLLLVVMENRLLILALISLVMLGPVVSRILLLGYVVFFTRAKIARDDNNVVHRSGRLKLIIDGLILVVLVLPLVVSTGIHRHRIALIINSA